MSLPDTILSGEQENDSNVLYIIISEGANSKLYLITINSYDGGVMNSKLQKLSQ